MDGKTPTAVQATALDDLIKEAERVKAQIGGVSKELSNPELDLGTSVRLNVARRELEAYLAGLLYALGEAPSRHGQV